MRLCVAPVCCALFAATCAALDPEALRAQLSQLDRAQPPPDGVQSVSPLAQPPLALDALSTRQSEAIAQARAQAADVARQAIASQYTDMSSNSGVMPLQPAMALDVESMKEQGAAFQAASQDAASAAAAQATDVLQATSQAKQSPINPVLELYRKWAIQYENDATEANKAARMYAGMSKSLLQGPLKANTASLASAEMSRIGVKNWGHAVFEFEKLLRNTAGSEAAAAAAKAAAPYNKIVNDYVKTQGAYDASAQGYALRLSMDVGLAKKLITYANQYRLQGNNGMADSFDNQATSLMTQADNWAGMAKSYYKTAMSLNAQEPGIQKMAGIAGVKAGWAKDPAGSIPQTHLYPFTPVPPLEFAQTGQHTVLVHGHDDDISFAAEPMVPPPMPPARSLRGL